MHASLPALAAARAAHIAAACLHTPRIAERRLPLGPARKPEATRVRADQDHLFRGGPWHALSSLARAHAPATRNSSLTVDMIARARVLGAAPGLA